MRTWCVLLALILCFCSSLASDKVQLTYMFWGGEDEREIRMSFAEGFNQSQDSIEIRPIHAPDDYDRKLKTMMGAGMAPDIFHLSDSEVAKWAAKGVLLDLLPYYERDPEASLDEFVPQEVEKRMFGGRFYGISDATETMVVFYGTELFNRWNVPQPPTDRVWTWDEFVETAKALTKDTDGDGRTDQYGCYVPLWDGTVDPMIWSLGGEHYTHDFLHLYTDREAAVGAFQLVNDLIRVHRVMPPRSEMMAQGQTVSQLLETGRLGMLLTGQWYLATLAGANFPFDVAPFPTIDEPSNILISSNFSIYAHTKHPDEAWEAYKFLSGEKGQILLSSSGLVMPTYEWLLFTPEGRRLWQKPNVHPPNHTFACVEPILYARYTRPFSGGDQLYFEVQRRHYEDLVYAESGDEVRQIVLNMCDDADGFLQEFDSRAREEKRQGSKNLFITRVGGVFAHRKAVITAVALPFVLFIGWAMLRLKRPRATLRERQAMAGYLFVLPAIAGLLVFSLGPILFSLFISLTQWDIVTPPRFVGFEQYSQIAQDRTVLKALWVTFYYTVINVPLGTLAGLLVAILLNTKVRGMRIFRTIYYLPSIVPAVATAVLWVWVFNPEYGLLNSIMKGINTLLDLCFVVFGGSPLHLNDHLEWLQDPTLVMPALWIMGLWGAGGAMIIYLAGLQGIPQHLYECADLDGAGWLGKFRHITIPMISPVIFFNLIMGTIGSFQVFIAGYLMTGGGPRDATLFYVLYLYRNAFHYLKMGYASALAWILFVIILIMTLILFKTAGKRVYYETG